MIFRLFLFVWLFCFEGKLLGTVMTKIRATRTSSLFKQLVVNNSLIQYNLEENLKGICGFNGI